MSMSVVACGADKVKSFDQIDTSKFSAFLNGDGDCVVIYEGNIDGAVMGATLSKDGFESISFTVIIQ